MAAAKAQHEKEKELEIFKMKQDTKLKLAHEKQKLEMELEQKKNDKLHDQKLAILKAKKEIVIASQKESEIEVLKRTVYDLKSQVSDLKFELEK